MKSIVVILSLFSISIFAGEKEQQDQFFIRPTDPTIDASQLASKNVKVLPAYDQSSSKTSLPSIELRNKVFVESNLWEKVKDWDDFDRDSLYINLERSGEVVIAFILKKHPELDKQSLERAQSLIAKTGITK